MEFIDSHCHLEHELYADGLDGVAANMRKAGVSKAITCGTGPQNNLKTLKIAAKYAEVEACLGVSPYEALGDWKNELSAIKSARDKIVGIGEIGLDRHHYHKPEEWQKQETCFTAFVELAESLDLPVVVHTRKAEERVFEILSNYKDVRVMLHCFLVPKLALEAQERGWLVSLPTIKSKSREKIAKALQLEKLACETDSPFLWTDEKGAFARNEPANVVEAYAAIAEARKQDLEEVAGRVSGNARTFYGLK